MRTLLAAAALALCACTTTPQCPFPCHRDYEREFAIGLEDLIGRWQYDVDHRLMTFELRRQADILEIGERANR